MLKLRVSVLFPAFHANKALSLSGLSFRMTFSGDSPCFHSISSKDLRMTHQGSSVESTMNIESLLVPITLSPYPDRICPRRNTQKFTVPRYNKLWSWWVSRSRRNTIYVNQMSFSPRKNERTTYRPYSATER